MKVVLAGGGTAGHINPALAIANFVKEKVPDAEILYIGAKGGMEEELVAKAVYDFKGITVTGFSRKLNLSGFKKNLETIGHFITSCQDCKKILKEFNPDVCIGTGGYVSGPVLWEASALKIPTLIHEQNAFPGITTKMLSKRVNVVMLASKEARKFLDKKCRCELTGNPIRGEVLLKQKSVARKELGLDSRPVVLSFGGSLGAKKINEAVIDLMKDVAKDDRYQLIHGFGKRNDWFEDAVLKSGIKKSEHKNFDIRKYIDNMATCLAAADLVICRAGAISLSEIEAQGKASILIPSPNVAENHQYHNAIELVNNNAAEIIEEKDLSGESLVKKVDGLLKDRGKLSEFEKNAKSMAIVDANERIYGLIEEFVS